MNTLFIPQLILSIIVFLPGLILFIGLLFLGLLMFIENFILDKRNNIKTNNGHN